MTPNAARASACLIAAMAVDMDVAMASTFGTLPSSALPRRFE
jgi:hypothetical protein